jgi:hypothetical protein
MEQNKKGTLSRKGATPRDDHSGDVTDHHPRAESPRRTSGTPFTFHVAKAPRRTLNVAHPLPTPRQGHCSLFDLVCPMEDANYRVRGKGDVLELTQRRG